MRERAWYYLRSHLYIVILNVQTQVTGNGYFPRELHVTPSACVYDVVRCDSGLSFSAQRTCDWALPSTHAKGRSHRSACFRWSTQATDTAQSKRGLLHGLCRPTARRWLLAHLALALRQHLGQTPPQVLARGLALRLGALLRWTKRPLRE